MPWSSRDRRLWWLILVAAKALARALAAWRDISILNLVTINNHGSPLEASILSAGSVAVLPVEIAAVAAIDPTASLPFVYSYAATLLFSLARLRAFKAIWLVAAVAAPAAAAADLIGSGADRLLNMLLVSSRIGSAVLAFALLPFVLMALRLTIQPSEPLSVWGSRWRLSPLILMMALVIATTGAVLFFYPSAG